MYTVLSVGTIAAILAVVMGVIGFGGWLVVYCLAAAIAPSFQRAHLFSPDGAFRSATIVGAICAGVTAVGVVLIFRIFFWGV